jgi:sugar lactone lactonase YvrE
MCRPRSRFHILALALAFTNNAMIVSVARAQARTEITLSESGTMPENVTSSQDGSVYFGSTTTGTIYRAAPGATQAQPWILAATSGLSNVLGVLADDTRNTLWVCQNSTGGRGGAPVAGQVALRSFDLRSGAVKGTYPFPADAGVCNDIAIASNGVVYVTESFRGRIHRLRPGASSLEEWFSAPQELNGVDGLAFLADGALYVNDFFSGRLYRFRVNADGSAGQMVAIETSLPLTRPDGLRSAGSKTLVQAEGQGRVTELTIDGDRAVVRVLKDGLNGATGVTVVGSDLVVLYARSKAAVVPYRQ